MQVPLVCAVFTWRQRLLQQTSVRTSQTSSSFISFAQGSHTYFQAIGPDQTQHFVLLDDALPNLVGCGLVFGPPCCFTLARVSAGSAISLSMSTGIPCRSGDGALAFCPAPGAQSQSRAGWPRYGKYMWFEPPVKHKAETGRGPDRGPIHATG